MLMVTGSRRCKAWSRLAGTHLKERNKVVLDEQLFGGIGAVSSKLQRIETKAPKNVDAPVLLP